MLKQVGHTLQAPDSVHSHEAEQAAKQITNECQQIFDEIGNMLDKVRTRRKDGSWGPTAIQKFKWCFKKHKVTYLLAQLESLKLSLSVMLQILQLGKLMAAPTKEYVWSASVEGSVTNHKNSDIKEAVTNRTEAIQQERFETQNIIIVRYYQITRLDHLYNAAEREDKEDRLAEAEGKVNGLLGDGTSQLALEAPPDYSQSCALTRLPVFSLGQLDQSLHQIRHSPKEMLQASDRVIDPLLEQWTILEELRQHNGNRDSAGSARYVPSVHDLPEEDEDRLKKMDFHDREESPQGYLLEGLTTDWRRPQSAAAKREASRLRKQYTGYQPSIDVEEAEEEEGVKVPSSRVTRRYAVDSSSESSESEVEEKPRRRRKSSGSPTAEKKRQFSDGPPLAHTYGPAQSSFGGRYAVSPNPTPGSTPRSSISAPRSPGEHRPAPTPTQNPMHHSISSPLPPVHTSNAPNPYAPYNPYSPTGAPPLYQGPREQTYPGNWHMPPQQQRLPLPTRPVSQDGKARSPSRLSTHSSSSRSRPMTTKEIAAEKVKQDRMLAKSATKGILGASGIAMFLDALEGL
jgi:hypothetical protein